MSDIKFIYFKGCPEAKNVRAALLSAGLFDFTVILQDDLPEGDPWKNYSSPAVLKGDELIYGIRTSGERSTCTFDFINFVEHGPLTKRFKELNTSQVSPNKNSRSMIGLIFSSLLVLKCPACIPGLVVFLSAFGPGFIITQTFLKGILLFFLVLTLSGLVLSFVKKHRNILPLVAGSFSSVLLYVGKFHQFEGLNNLLLINFSLAGLVSALILDLVLGRKARCPSCL